MQDPDIRKLRLLLAVSEHGSFTKAAAALDIDQSGLSRIIRQLEEMFGAPLLRRDGRGVQSTEFGAMVLDHVRDILEQIDALKRAAGSISEVPNGTVLLGLPHSASMILTEPLFNRLRRQYPEIRLNISEAFTGNLSEWLSTGRLDIAVLYDPGESAHLVYRHLLIEDLFFCTSGRRSGRGQSIGMAEAMASPLVLPSRPHGLRLLVDAAARAAGLNPEVVLESNAMPMIKSVVAKGGVGTIMPFGAVHREVEAGQILARRIVDPELCRSLVVAETVKRPPSRATDAVVECIVDETRRLVSQGKWLGPKT